MKTCVRKEGAACHNYQGAEVHNCITDKIGTSPMPVRGVHAARRDAYGRGPKIAGRQRRGARATHSPGGEL